MSTVSLPAIENRPKTPTIVKAPTGQPKLTDEDKFQAMLGRVDLSESFFVREEFCGACGTIHTKAELLDIYMFCKACHSVLREPNHLRKRYKYIEQVHPLEVLFASYGDCFDPDFGIDCTEQVSKRVQESSSKDRLAFKPWHKVNELLKVTDPCPSKPKQLKIRYRANYVHATIIIDFMPNNQLPSPLVLIAPRQRYLKLFGATYGHPKGVSSTGRMSVDVVEVLQSLIDLNGGSFLTISPYQPLSMMLGDPCPGYTKDLRLQYEICGRAGQVTHTEVRGFLTKKLHIQQSPTVAPLIYVVSATYGVTPTARRDRLDLIQKMLRKIEYIEHRVKEGLRVMPDDIIILKKKRHLKKQRELLKLLPTNFIDVSVKLQKLCDKGETHLFLDKDSFDPNAVFGDPSHGKGFLKILECQLDCQGHDSERNTETNEMTETGYTRNFITTKRERFNIVVEDIGGPTLEEQLASLGYEGPAFSKSTVVAEFQHGTRNMPGVQFSASSADSEAGAGLGVPPEMLGEDGVVSFQGKMEKSLEFRTENASPVIVITRATYGETFDEGRDVSKTIDVTNDIQNMVVGRSLLIDTDVNLTKMFRKDPSPGRRKKLVVKYITRGITGNLRVREKDDCLVAGIELGYPPVPPPDDDNYIVG